MTVVVDTNVLTGMAGIGHPHGQILDAWLAGRLQWAVSTDILAEYEEILGKLKGATKAARFLSFIQLWGAQHGTLLQVSPSYFFRTIQADRDDDKFADCAIAVHADYIITSDRHFAPLVGSGYKPQPITPEEFIARHLTPAP